MKRILIAPQWAGSATSDFYPWLLAELDERRDAPSASIVPPPSRPPTPQSYGGAIDDALSALSAEELGHTVLLGHSVGSHALMQALARLDAGKRVGALVIVAGWWDISRATWASFGLPWEQIREWLDVQLDDDAVRARVGQIDVLVSKGDRIPASSAEETAAQYERRLGATTHVLEDRAHFNAPDEPAVLEVVSAALDRLA